MRAAAAIVLAVLACTAAATVRPGDEAAAGRAVQCETRAAALDRATAHADQRFAGQALRLQLAGVSCSDLAEVELSAVLAESIAEGMQVQAEKCPVPLLYAEDARTAAEGAVDLALVARALRAACAGGRRTP